MNILYLVRGLPGAGKSTLAKKLVGDNYREPDQFFVNEDGEYVFDYRRVDRAVKWCQQEILRLIATGVKEVAVAGVFTRLERLQFYKDLAKRYNYNVIVIEVHSNFESTHGVPNYSINLMKKNWEHIPV